MLGEWTRWFEFTLGMQDYSENASVVALGENSYFNIYERSNDSYSLALNYEVNETVN